MKHTTQKKKRKIEARCCSRLYVAKKENPMSKQDHFFMVKACIHWLSYSSTHCLSWHYMAVVPSYQRRSTPNKLSGGWQRFSPSPAEEWAQRVVLFFFWPSLRLFFYSYVQEQFRPIDQLTKLISMIYCWCYHPLRIRQILTSNPSSSEYTIIIRNSLYPHALLLLPLRKQRFFLNIARFSSQSSHTQLGKKPYATCGTAQGILVVWADKMELSASSYELIVPDSEDERNTLFLVAFYPRVTPTCLWTLSPWVVCCTYMRVWHCCLRLLGSKLDVSVNQLVCVGTEKELDIKRKQGGATTLPLISRKKRHSHLELCIANTFLTREGRKSLFVREVEEV